MANGHVGETGSQQLSRLGELAHGKRSNDKTHEQERKTNLRVCISRIFFKNNCSL